MSSQTKNLTGQANPIKVVSFSKELVEPALDLLELSYNQLNPIFVDLKMSSENFRQLMKETLEDTRCYPYSFVLVDSEKNEKVIGLKIIKDFSTIPTGKPELNHSCPKINYKIDLDYKLFRPELEKKYEPGVAASSALMALDPEYAGRGLGKMLNQGDIKTCYENGFKKSINVQYNKVTTQLVLKFGDNTRIANQLDISGDEVGGERPFKDNTDGATLVVVEVDDALVSKVGMGYLIEQRKQKLKLKQQQQSEEQIQEKQ